MYRVLRYSIIAAFAAAAAVSGTAYADDDADGLKALVADCGGANVKQDDIDSCLERARELGETSPSPLLQGLTARLERMAERGEDNSDLSKSYSVGNPAEPSAGGGGVAGPAAAPLAPHGEMH